MFWMRERATIRNEEKYFLIKDVTFLLYTLFIPL